MWLFLNIPEHKLESNQNRISDSNIKMPVPSRSKEIFDVVVVCETSLARLEPSRREQRNLWSHHYGAAKDGSRNLTSFLPFLFLFLFCTLFLFSFPGLFLFLLILLRTTIA
jgi:hypothetical protein